MKTTTKEKLENIIKRTGYYYVNSDLNTKNFPIPKTIQTKNWKIITIDKSMSSQECLDKIKAEGCRPANAYELALWSKNHREEVPKVKWYIALGQTWFADGYHRVPSVSAHSDGDFGFGLGHFGGVWGGDGAFLCFCDSTLSLGHSKVQNLDSLTLRIKNLEEKLEKIREILK